jgi:RNA polymerase sigma-70 factor (ECF subfamily)
VRRLDRFDGRSAFGTWAYRVATNACLDELRRRNRRPDPIDPATLHHRAVGTDPAASVTDRLTLDEALAGMPIEFRTVLVLREVVGLDYAEIAETLELPLGTVRSRLARARGRLARLLVDEDGNPGVPVERRTPGAPAPPDPNP